MQKAIILQEFLEKEGMSPLEFAQRVELPKKIIKGIFLNTVEINEEIAKKLSCATGISYRIWMKK